MAETDTPPRTGTSPTRSLRAAMNPQARMQELLQRDANAVQPEAVEANPETQLGDNSLLDSSATSSVVAQKFRGGVAQ